MVIIIPAYNPDKHLLDVIKELKTRFKYQIIVVNDGSKNIETFDKIKKDVTLLSHDINKGKGAAMKTALKYLQDKKIDGFIFVDADGQHKTDDIAKVIDYFYKEEDGLILGCRRFNKNTPFRSMLGNSITRILFHLISGLKISDTQTGLRCISKKYIPLLLKIEGDRYDYEMNMLTEFANKDIPIHEVSIEAIYESKKNLTSKYKVVRDSILIYKKFFKFIISSFCSFLIDYILFIIFNLSFKKIILANILARTISGTFNYLVNKKIVFKSKKNSQSLLQYIILALVILSINSSILYIFNNMMGINSILAKLLVEMILFIFSYIVQKRVVFKK